MKLGTEDKKKVGALVGLGVVAAYLFYTNVLSEPGSPAPSAPVRPVAALRPPDPTAPAPAAPASSQPAAGSIRRATPGRTGRGEEFRPTLRAKRPEDRVDPATIDPTLRLDLFAKVQAVELAGGARNIFQFGTAPPPTPTAALPGKEPIVKPFIGPKPPPPPKPPEVVKKPPPTPINLKYYGFSSPKSGGRKTAFFLDGEDILVAIEGETVKQRYKVVRIGVNSVLMEDTVSNNQQTLPLQEEGTGA